LELFEMGRVYIRQAIKKPALAGIVAVLSACGNMAPPVEYGLYPTDFSVGVDPVMSTGMQQLGYQLQQLDLALMGAHDQRPDLSQYASSILLEVERIAGFLQAEDISVNHLFLRDDMNSFLTDVRQAREHTSMSPPQYYLAGRISGACINCHRTNR
jgi:hypothetical protein